MDVALADLLPTAIGMKAGGVGYYAVQFRPRRYRDAYATGNGSAARRFVQFTVINHSARTPIRKQNRSGRVMDDISQLRSRVATARTADDGAAEEQRPAARRCRAHRRRIAGAPTRRLEAAVSKAAQCQARRDAALSKAADCQADLDTAETPCPN